MRDPASIITAIREELTFDHEEVRRNVEITLRPARKRDDGKDLYLSLLNPKKGVLPDIRLEESGRTCRIVPHPEHVRVSQVMLYRRFFSVWKTISRPEATPSDVLASLDERMFDILLKLLQLPSMSPDDADSLVKELFVDSCLAAVLDAPGVEYDRKRMHGLHALCEELALRYPYLVAYTAQKGTPTMIAYSYRQPTGAMPERAPTRGRKRRREGFRRLHGLPPTSIRVHTPLAKRTDHYSITVSAPDEYFISSGKVLTESPAESGGAKSGDLAFAVPTELQVAYARGRGRRLRTFISGGATWQSRLYLGWTLEELPDRSTMRAFIAALLSATFMGVLGWIALFSTSDGLRNSDLPALVVSLVSVAALLSESMMPRGGYLGAPILARYGMLLTGVTTLAFALWLVYKPPGDAAPLHTAIGIALLFLQLSVLLGLGVRLGVIFNAYKAL